MYFSHYSRDQYCWSTLEEQLRWFWELESLGIRENESSLYDPFKINVNFNGTRYEVSLPWKDPIFDIPDNYDLCVRRLNSLVRRLKREPGMLLSMTR